MTHQFELRRQDRFRACIIREKRQLTSLRLIPPESRAIDEACSEAEKNYALRSRVFTPSAARSVLLAVEALHVKALEAAMHPHVVHHAARFPRLEYADLLQESIRLQLPTIHKFIPPLEPFTKEQWQDGLRRFVTRRVRWTASRLRRGLPLVGGPNGSQLTGDAGESQHRERVAPKYFSIDVVAEVEDTHAMLSEYEMERDLVDHERANAAAIERLMEAARRNPEHLRRIEALWKHEVNITAAAEELGLRSDALRGWLRDVRERGGLT